MCYYYYSKEHNTNIICQWHANLKKGDHIKNKQLLLSLRYIFVKMLLNGQDIIVIG